MVKTKVWRVVHDLSKEFHKLQCLKLNNGKQDL